MKKTVLLFAIIVISIGLNAQTFHGAKLKLNKKSIEAKAVATQLADKETAKLRVSGIVEDVCQAAGCWMKLTTENGKTMRVTFKDYGFFVPKDIAGKKITMEGVARKTETSVADLKHFAEDAGKKPEEIAKITKPEYAITFEADGVIIEN